MILTLGWCKFARSKSIRFCGDQAEGNGLERNQQRADPIKEFKRFPTASKPNKKPASRKTIFSLPEALTLDATFRGQSNKITCLKRTL